MAKMNLYVLPILLAILQIGSGRDNHPYELPNCHELMTPGGSDNEVLNERDIDLLKGYIRDLFHSDETGCTDDRRKDFIASYVRLAWHDAATWDPETQTGGPHARMRFPENPEHPSNDPDNAGFEDYMGYLEYIHNFFGDRISVADLWVLTALTAIEFGGGPTIPWRWGRVDEWNETLGYSDRLPHAWAATEDGELDDVWLLDHLVGVMERLEFRDPVKALVVLCGAHNLGGPRPYQTGMTPGWLFEPIPWTPVGIYFHNAFYSEMLWQRWWDSEAESPDVHITVHADNRTVMFYSDFALLWEDDARTLVHHYATNLHDFFEDFVSHFARLLEIGHEEGQLHEITPAYLWETGEWQMCSEFCGGGAQLRDVTCVAYPAMTEADEEMCEADRYGGPKPVISQPCNNQVCGDYVWQYSEWSECDRSCGGGIQFREVHCHAISSEDRVNDDYCSDLTVPREYQACNVDSCGYWDPKPGSEGVCDMPCENAWIVEDYPLYRELWTGETTGEFNCVKSFYGNPRIMPDQYCDEYDKPELVKCVARFCEQALPHWRATQWSDCNAECDGGTQTREVTCWGAPHDQTMRSGVNQLENSVCEVAPYYELQDLPHQYNPPGVMPTMPAQWGPKPAELRSCNNRPCRENMKIASLMRASSMTGSSSAASNVGSVSSVDVGSSAGASSVDGAGAGSSVVGVGSTSGVSSGSSKSDSASAAASASSNINSEQQGGESENENDASAADQVEDIVESEGGENVKDNTMMITGLSFGAFLLVGIGVAGRSWYKRKVRRDGFQKIGNDGGFDVSDGNLHGVQLIDKAAEASPTNFGLSSGSQSQQYSTFR